MARLRFAPAIWCHLFRLCSSSCRPTAASRSFAFLVAPRRGSVRQAHSTQQTAAAVAATVPVPPRDTLQGDTYTGSGVVGSNLDPAECLDVVVCGGGPAGLLAAIMMAQRFPNSKTVVYDRLHRPPSPDDSRVWDDVARFYLIGIGGRGQNALKRFGVWEEVLKRGVPVLGRKDWPPNSKEGVERIFTKRDKHVTTFVLPRDKLVGILVEFIESNYADVIRLCYDHEVQPIDLSYKDGSRALLRISTDVSQDSTVGSKRDDMKEVPRRSFAVEANFLIAADGTVRTIANSIEEADARQLRGRPLRRLRSRPFRVRRYVDDNQRVYKSIPMKLPDGWRWDLNYSARTSDGRAVFDALPANSCGDYCGVLLLRADDEFAKADVEPTRFRGFLDKSLPQFSQLISDEDVVAIARKPVSYLPGFRYSGPRLHQDHCVLLGDNAHTVKPYFGLGANSALEDVLVLSEVFDDVGSDIGLVASAYSRRRAKEAKALVRLSRNLDRPGRLGFLTFILPLILDSVFFGLAPKVFTPNVITMLQREQYTFTEVARRKRIDRILQIGCIGWTVTAAYFLASRLVSRLASLRCVGAAAPAVVLLSMFAALTSSKATRSLASRVTNSRTFLTPLRHLGKESESGETFLTAIGNNSTRLAEQQST